MSRKAWLFWLLVIVVVAALDYIRAWQYLPPEWSPFAPVALDHRMTPVTRWKLNSLRDEQAECIDVLATAPDNWLDHLPLEDYTPVESCPLTNVVRVTRTSAELSSTFTATCPLVAAWVMFEQQQLQPLAREHLGSPVVRLDHYGTFACRNIYHRENARRSEHASAAALDLAGFRLADGRRISVLEDWDNDADPARRKFLKAVHSAACDYFGTVLGPDYNKPHENHFHLDTSRFGICR
ncbi:extensin family protein [Marinobacter lacisalsi]|uniref:Extensin family protein n=1 Tax=Marinobacter lacisalsi TaxID=475979 RepID=A0ABV8QEJ8_9GAMM